MDYLTGNDVQPRKKSQEAASIFAEEVLRHIGPSCVYIEPKKSEKMIDIDGAK